MQRLFSTFPNDWPGFGLLILRVTSGFPLVALTTPQTWSWPDTFIQWMQLLRLPAALLTLAGLWTPFVAALLAMLQGGLAYVDDAGVLMRWMPALVPLSLVMLGPGAWSIDALLYGRKRIDLRNF
jgi:uncharacterized membrane protein YphA (DoxX/SURF4 family)